MVVGFEIGCFWERVVWFGWSKRRQRPEHQRVTASLAAGLMVVGFEGSWRLVWTIKVRGLMVLVQRFFDLGSVLKGSLFGGTWSMEQDWWTTRHGQSTPPLGEITKRTTKESLPSNPIFKFWEFGCFSVQVFSRIGNYREICHTYHTCITLFRDKCDLLTSTFINDLRNSSHKSHFFWPPTVYLLYPPKKSVICVTDSVSP